LNEERVYHWLTVGAQPSESVQKFFKVVKLVERLNAFKAGEDQKALIDEASKLYQARAAKIAAK
jgi:small subunit ribosomal protein S16